MNYWQELLKTEKDAHNATLLKLLAAETERDKLKQQAREFQITSTMLGDTQHRLSQEQFEHSQTKAELVRARAELDTTQRALKQYKALHTADPFANREKVVTPGPKA